MSSPELRKARTIKKASGAGAAQLPHAPVLVHMAQRAPASAQSVAGDIDMDDDHHMLEEMPPRSKITCHGTRLCQQRILEIWDLRQRLSRGNSHTLMMTTCARLGEILDAVLLDLNTGNLKISKDKKKIWRMEEKVAAARIQFVEAFTKDCGPSIQTLHETARHNGNALRCLTNHVEKCNENPRAMPIASRLLLSVEELDKVNEPAKNSASILIDMLKKIHLRVQDEEVWMQEFTAYSHELVQKLLGASLELGKLEDQVVQFKCQTTQFLNGGANSCAVQEVIEVLGSVELCTRNFSLQLKLLNAVHGEIKIVESILNDKMRYLLEFNTNQQKMLNIFKEISPVLCGIKTKIDRLMQIHGLTLTEPPSLKECLSYNEDAFQSLEDLTFDFCFSWRKRRFHNRSILPPVRDQSAGTCAYQATLTSTESLYKREFAAYPTILKDKNGQADEFIINLSRTQLEDIVEDFYRRHKAKGKAKLNVCLEKMKREGVTSEEAYNDPHVQPAKRYRIKRYEEMDLELKRFEEIDAELTVGHLRGEVQEIMKKPLGRKKRRKLLRRKRRKVLHKIKHCVISHLRQGKVLIANFLVTRDYHRLLPHDIYRVPEREAQYEVNKEGKPWSHCVVVVGFGIRNRETYLIYQNSYGTSCGDGGYGRIYLSSVRKLFVAHV
ncbi:unnamed protein product [Urochloa humidicola]